MEALNMFAATVSAMGPLCLVTFSGALLAHFQVLNKRSNEITATACFKFLLPTFVLVNITKGIDFSSISHWWPLIVVPLIAILISSIVGALHTFFLNPPKHVRFSMNYLLIFANLTNAPVLLLNGACSSYGPLYGEDSCDKVNTYIFLQVMLFNLIAISGGYGLVYLDYLEKTKAKDDSLTPNEGPQISLKKMIIKQFYSPIPLMIYIGCILGSIPGVKSTFTEEDAPLAPVFDSLYMVGHSGVVLSQMVLGSNMWLTRKQEAVVTRRYIATVIVLRCVVITFIGVVFIWWLYNLGIFGDDLVMAYLCLMNFASPTAIYITLICQFFKVGLEETSAVLFWMYITSFVSLTLSGYVFFLIT